MFRCEAHADKLGDHCAICLEGMDDRRTQIRNCGHCFHRDCLLEWTTTYRHSCPLCNADVGTIDPAHLASLQQPQPMTHRQTMQFHGHLNSFFDTCMEIGTVRFCSSRSCTIDQVMECFSAYCRFKGVDIALDTSPAQLAALLLPTILMLSREAQTPCPFITTSGEVHGVSIDLAATLAVFS